MRYRFRKRNVLLIGASILLAALCAACAVPTSSATEGGSTVVRRSAAFEEEKAQPPDGLYTPTDSLPTQQLRSSVKIRTEVLYRNVRFDYQVRYPRGWHIKESDNGDGATFTSPDAAFHLLIFAGNNIGFYRDVNDAVDKYRQTEQAKCAKPLVETQRKAINISQIKGQRIFWQCAVAKQKHATVAAFLLHENTLYGLVLEQLGTTRAAPALPPSTVFDAILETWRIGQAKPEEVVSRKR